MFEEEQSSGKIMFERVEGKGEWEAKWRAEDLMTFHDQADLQTHGLKVYVIINKGSVGLR